MSLIEETSAAIREATALIVRQRAVIIELVEASSDYAKLVQVENFPAADAAVGRAYERLRSAIDGAAA